MAVNREQALAIVCDLAFTIGGEVSLSTLLLKTLQRFLYHTGFPVGLLLTDETRVTADAPTIEARLEMAIGDFRLMHRQDRYLNVPAALLPPAPALIEAKASLMELGTHRPMAAALTLPVEGYGHMLLLSPGMPDTALPLTELFLPVLSRMATAITLCRGYERDVERRIERKIHYDPLTGLPNATLFSATLDETLPKAAREGQLLAVAYLDVDDFIELNNRHGKEKGDALLVAFADRLRQLTRAGDHVAHLRGDEFALLFTALANLEELDARLAHLQRHCDQIALDGEEYSMRATIGVSLYPVDAKAADSLLRHAQMALHDAKTNARGEYRLFDAEQDQRAQERRLLLHEVSTAMERSELCLHYQPKVDMISGALIGVEALLRWRLPDGRLRPPGEFLPALESSDLICRLGRWVMAQALTQSVAWRDAGLAVPISVNIAARHLQESNFIDQVREALAAQPGAKGGDLEIEILETSAIQEFEHVRRIIDACRDLGVSIALDDFGTGYSSLAYLSQLPATILKIDQVFVRKLFDQKSDPAIIRAIVQIAEVFGCQVVAEGVETVEHGLALIGMGCRYAQGFGIARPMPAADLLAWSEAYRIPHDWPAARQTPWSNAEYERIKQRWVNRRPET